jgi:chorismate dehydratase
LLNRQFQESIVDNTNHAANSALTIAASTYLNSAPLVWSFLHGRKREEVKLIDAVPAQCAELLRQKVVDVALIPVIEYHRIHDISLVSNVCVGSKTEVRSVLLVSKQHDIGKITSIALDESSRTSAALLKIIFGEFVRRDPTWRNSSPNLGEMLADNDAALIIGDPAMTIPRAGLHIWDMAGLWRKHTGLGFVFAMWAVRNDATERAKQVDFAGARDEGVACLEEIVNYYVPRIPLSREELRFYLTDNIAFDLDDQMQQGLELYFKLAAKHDLIDEAKEPVFFGVR